MGKFFTLVNTCYGEIFVTIGDRLREERTRLRLSQPSLAELAGTTKKTVFSWETGKTAPDADQLAVLMSAGVDVPYVLTGVRGENVATTPQELAVLRLFRAFPTAESRLAGLQMLVSFLKVFTPAEN